MSCIIEVAPFDGGWCVKLCDTGEVLFFQTGCQAKREAHRLAAAWPGARVRVHDLFRELMAERHVPVEPTRASFPYPLGPPS